MLLNIPLNEEVPVKVEEDDCNPIITVQSSTKRQENK